MLRNGFNLDTIEVYIITKKMDFSDIDKQHCTEGEAPLKTIN